LNTVLAIATACGSSQSGASGSFAGTANEGEVAEAAINLDLSGVSQQVEDVKDQVVDAIRGIVDQAPEPVRTALDQLLDVIDVGQAGQLKIGNATSTISPTKNGIQVVSTAAGAVVGVLGIPEVNAQGNPIPGTAEATENGLIIVEVGRSEATVAVDATAGTAKASASPAIVTLKVRDITQVQPTYTEIPVAPGETQTVLEGTPLESTVTAADSVIENKKTTAAAASDAVRLDLIKGVQGGIHVALGRTTGAARVEAAPVQPAPEPEPEPEPLPVTGANNLLPLGLLLLAGAAGLVWIRRRVN
jgi:LPXTG-motif cell wall-anchored protein